MAALVSLEDLELVEEIERRLERKQRRRAAAPPRRDMPSPSEQMRIWSGEA